APPEIADGASVLRRTDDPMTCDISWNPSQGAVGYNVLWGIEENKLYTSWLVYDQNSLELRALNSDSSYAVRIDAFNENGITKGNVVDVS
ncbi:MAG: fibronectin type III domain-containing protein, partial [Kiritimatiellae bacterium]|nr:fibronectin type III domain-containing protein [Kiritimatiellia bacterium]